MVSFAHLPPGTVTPLGIGQEAYCRYNRSGWDVVESRILALQPSE